MRLFHLEPVQRASVIQMVFGKRPRQALHADDPRAVGKPPPARSTVARLIGGMGRGLAVLSATTDARVERPTGPDSIRVRCRATSPCA
jgi:hypothetical protein